MNNKYLIYTIGYTLFKKGSTIDIEALFGTLRKFGVNYLVDVRSVPFSKQYPQCNADNMKIAGRSLGIPYMNMPEIGAKINKEYDVFSKASDIFLEQSVFPIAKSNRPEKTELLSSDEIVDFRKFRLNEVFINGLKRIETACHKGYTLCLMCGEKNPIDCHRYFLVSKALEQRFGDWLDVRHIVENLDGRIGYISNYDLDKQLEEFVCEKKHVLNSMFIDDILENYSGKTGQDKLNDFCDRYWNLFHGWKKNNYNNNKNYD